MTKVHECVLHSIGEAFNHHRLPVNLAEPPAVARATTGSELPSHTIHTLGATHDPQASPLRFGADARPAGGQPGRFRIEWPICPTG
ncbi:hypothetical protein [Streptomyces sp. NPDC058249]|uniref:hypothetical protein n=1 Tax=Streptomyces sp. NPDC058249 TaxID=3346403 RepID=UPI0036E62D3E